MCQRVSGAGTNSCSSPGAFGCTPPIPGDINGNTPGTQGAVRVTLDVSPNIPIGHQPQLTVEITDNSNGSALPFPDYPYIVTWNGSCTTPNTTCTGGPQTTGTIDASECTGISFNRNCKFSLTAPAGVYTDGGTAYPISMYVTSTKINSRGYYTTYVLTSCPATAPTPAPDPSNWIQLRDSSFAGLGPLNNPIPAGIENRYFVSCTNSPTCTTNDPGEVVASTIDLGGAPASPKGWQATGAVFSPTTSVSSFISYVKARKPYVGPLTSYDNTGTNNTIYYITGNQTHTNQGAGGESDITTGNNKVYIIDGNLTINTDFNTANRSIAVFVKGDLNIDSSVTSINGIFVVQGTINTGTANNSTLVVNGNLISQDSLVNGRASGSESAPSLRIQFAPKYYMDLLPLLSVTTYDWKQLQ